MDSLLGAGGPVGARANGTREEVGPDALWWQQIEGVGRGFAHDLHSSSAAEGSRAVVEDRRMRVMALFGFAAFVGAGLAVGTRLLVLARRTRELPEIAIGGALFAGGLGYCAFILGFALRVLPEASLPWVHALAVAALDAGVVALVLGIWKIFRPSAPLARVAFVATAASLAIHWAASIAAFDPTGHRGPFVFWLFNAVGAGAYAWSAGESFRYSALLRRRARLGLADAELVNRFLLWGLAGSCGFGLFAVGMANRVVGEGGTHAVPMFLQSALGFGAAAFIWLAFFPPDAYLRRIVGEGR
jgi:hypothetical protein